MENKEIITGIQKLSKDLDSQRGTLTSVLNMLVKMGDAVNEGFDKINERLAILEGKQGMQGVNSQLLDIKHELHKIQKAYPYDDMFANLQTVAKA